MSKGNWKLRPTEVARFVKTVKETGLPIVNVEYSAETRLVRVNIGPAPAVEIAVEPVEQRGPVVL